MPQQDLDGLVLAITARLHADLARFCVLPGSEGQCSWTAPTDTLIRKLTVTKQAAAPGAAQRSRVLAGSMDAGQVAGSRVTL
jgi:hypothetical protein